MRPYIVASIVVFMGAFIRIANAQCGCCSQPNCWCCPQTTTNATTAASLKVCSIGACAGINPGSAIGPCINGTCASPALCVNGQCEC
uniref:Uncharacterized protein n=1 Tax=Acrobeloides nanus TaxID=290746 RepID=A0A914DZX4_9BILA